MAKVTSEKYNARNRRLQLIFGVEVRNTRSKVSTSRCAAYNKALDQVDMKLLLALGRRCPAHNLERIFKADRKSMFRSKAVLNANNNRVNLGSYGAACFVISLEAASDVASAVHVDEEGKSVCGSSGLDVAAEADLGAVSHGDGEFVNGEAWLRGDGVVGSVHADDGGVGWEVVGELAGSGLVC